MVVSTHDNAFDPNGPAAADAGIFGLCVPSNAAGLVLVPVPLDATTSYMRGTSRGPTAILAASHQLDLVDPDAVNAYQAGICMVPEPPEMSEANARLAAAVEHVRHVGMPASDLLLADVNDTLGQIHGSVRDQVAVWLRRDKIVGVVGGEHSVAFGSIAAHLERFPQMAVLHVDAHADLRQAYEGLVWSHASVMYNVLERTKLAKLVQVGVRDLCPWEEKYARDAAGRIVTFPDHSLARDELQGVSFATSAERIVACLPAEVYVSFDIDGLDPVLCPHTGTPVPGGLSYRQACWLLSAIGSSGRRIVGFDLTEVAPGPGPACESWDANVGARILFKMCGAALAASRPRTHARDQ